MAGRIGIEVGRGCGGMSSLACSPPPRLISERLWPLVEPLIPPQRPAEYGRTGGLGPAIAMCFRASSSC